MFLYPNVLYISMGVEDMVRLSDLLEMSSCCYVVFSKTRGPEKNLLPPLNVPERRASGECGSGPVSRFLVGSS
jgi:hypothetical protein